MKLLFALAVVGCEARRLLLSTRSTMKAKMEAVKKMNRQMDAVRRTVAKKAASKGQSYLQWASEGDDDDFVYGADGVEHEMIDMPGTISAHAFTALRNDDPVEPDAYPDEDIQQIDADDEADNFGADAEDSDQ